VIIIVRVVNIFPLPKSAFNPFRIQAVPRWNGVDLPERRRADAIVAAAAALPAGSAMIVFQLPHVPAVNRAALRRRIDISQRVMTDRRGGGGGGRPP